MNINRRKFLRAFGIGSAVVVTNPIPLLEALIPAHVITPTVYKFTAKIRITEELLLDSQFDIFAIAQAEFAKSLAGEFEHDRIFGE